MRMELELVQVRLGSVTSAVPYFCLASIENSESFKSTIFFWTFSDNSCLAKKMADDSLSDEQLQQLLKDAEQRLRGKGKKQTQVSELSALSSRYCAPPNI